MALRHGKPTSYLQARQAVVRQALAKHKLDGLLLTHPPDLAYLSDFTGHDSIGLITQDKFYLVTDFRYAEQAQLEAPWLGVRMRKAKMSDALAQTITAAKVRRIGFEANFTPFGQIQTLKKAMGAKQAKLEPVRDLMLKIRQVKDEREIAIIKEAVAAAQGAFVAVRDQLKIGQTENYLAGLLGFEMRQRGASDSSFETIIAAGSASSLPHYRPSERAVSANQPLLIDWGARFGGYCSDLTRTLLLGNVSPKIEKAYNVVLEAQLTAIQTIRPGVGNRQVDRAARSVIEKAGYGPKFGHGLGHGIGRDIHELPVLGKTAEADELKPGMIVTVEPGIYLPGVGGVRIEDDVLVTPGGNQVLSNLGKTFEECHLE